MWPLEEILMYNERCICGCRQIWELAFLGISDCFAYASQDDMPDPYPKILWMMQSCPKCHTINSTIVLEKLTNEDVDYWEEKLYPKGS